MFYAHLIEDLLALHISECSYFHVNGYAGLSRKQIRDMKHEKRIDEMLVIYGDQDKKDGSITRLVTALHHLRHIRNHPAHAIIPQVGSDFAAEEGVDQIIAMLRHVSYWEHSCLKTMKLTHESLLRHTITTCFEAVLERDEPLFDARLSQSNIQMNLDSLRKLFEP